MITARSEVGHKVSWLIRSMYRSPRWCFGSAENLRWTNTSGASLRCSASKSKISNGVRNVATIAQRVKADIVRQLDFLGISKEELAAAGRMSLRTLQRNLKEPEKMDLADLERFCKKLKIKVKFEYEM